MRPAASLTLAALLPLVALSCAAPDRPPCAAPEGPRQLGSLCGFENPEDVEVVSTAGLLLVSQMRIGARGGSLAAWPLEGGAPRLLWPPPEGATAATAAGPAVGDPSCTTPPGAESFSPHGISTVPDAERGSISVGVVAHGDREAIELFELRGRGVDARLHWRGCVPTPGSIAANDLSLASLNDFIASSYQPCTSGLAGLWHSIRGGLGLETGEVLHWHDGGWTSVPSSGGANPNGVLFDREGEIVFAAETGRGVVARIDLAGGERSEVEIEGHPDNLSRSADGRVLVVSHASGLSFLRCALVGGPCRAPWTLDAIDPESLARERLIEHDGSVLGASSSASVGEGAIFLGAVFGDRIGVWQRPSPAR